MRKKIVAGNWKMHGSRSEVEALIHEIKQNAVPQAQVELIVFPSFVHLQQVEASLQGSVVKMGGQNLYLGLNGAFTGEVSGPMLRDYGCQYVLVGHSERRSLFHDDLRLVTEKLNAALDAGLIPILCIGETQAEREQGQTNAVILRQLESVFNNIPLERLSQLIIAYEPVWAIGTGLTASPEEAQAVHAFIRANLAKYSVDIANSLRILYGGSVKADNARDLFSMPDIDGGLVGGASLKAASFLAIAKAAE